MRIIRFRRLHRDKWEIAFSEEHLFWKLNGEMAEIRMPAKPWLARLLLRFFPMRGIDCEVEK